MQPATLGYLIYNTFLPSLLHGMQLAQALHSVIDIIYLT